MNVVALFEDQARAHPAAVALSWHGGSLRYDELAELARRLDAVLEASGIDAGDRIAILLPTAPVFAVALLGSLRHGAVAAVLSPAWAPADIARALALADARLLITTPALAATVGAESHLTFLIDDAEVGGVGAALLRAAPATQPPSACDPDTPATILFSSGTTGEPKGVVLTHGNLAFNARSKIRYCGITPADRLAMVVPIAHCFGQNVILLGALLAGASVRVFSRFDAVEVRDAIARSEVSMLLAAPTAFERLLALRDRSPLRRLRYALTAAAPASPTLSARWRAATGVALAQGYGLTECSPFATYDPGTGDDARSVGRPIDGVEVAIVRPDDSRAAAGEVGEIVVRGPNVMAGYWRRPEATAHALRGGWLHTGDVGLMNAAGCVHLIDRLDDVINVAGFKAWPSDVERALAAHPDVLEAAAYASTDAMRGSVVAAAVTLRAGSAITPADLLQFVAPRLAGFQRPARLRILDALPRSASGKVLRRTLAAQDQREPHSTPA